MTIWRSLCIVCLLLATLTRADVVETRDGRRLEGAVSFESESIVVQSDSGSTSLKLDELKSLQRITAAAKEQAEPVNGLLAEFFGDANYKDSPAVMIVPMASFDWGHAPPTPVAPELYYARLSGFITIPQRANYRFGGSGFHRITVNGRVIGENKELDDKGVIFEAGQRVPVQFEFRKEKGVHARGNFFWSINHVHGEGVPQSVFTPPDDFIQRMIAFEKTSLPNRFGGLKGEYFTDAAMTQLAFVRLDSTVAFMHNDASQVDPSFKTGFAGRWTGRIKAPKTMTAKFAVTAPSKLWINNQLLFDTQADTNRKKPGEATLAVEAGKFYDVKLEAVVQKGFFNLRLVTNLEAEWMPPMSTNFLYPPSDLPRVSIVAPLNGTELDTTEGSPFRVVATAGKSPIKKIELLTQDGREVLGEVTAPPFDAISIRSKTTGEFTVQARVTDEAGLTSRSEVRQYSISSAGSDRTNPQWSRGRVGSSQPPSVKESDGQIEVIGKNGVFGGECNLPLVSKLMQSDGELVARLVSIQCAKPTVIALAGLSFRQNMRAEGPHITLLGGTSQSWFASHLAHQQIPAEGQPPLTLPIWLKISRTGNSAIASYSHDGTSWTSAGSIAVDERSRIIAGLTAFAFNSEEPVTAVFDQVAIHLSESAPLAKAPGVQLVEGTILSGEMSVNADEIVLRTLEGKTHSFPKARVARIFYRAIPGSLRERLVDGFRGAVLNGDLLEGEVSNLTGDGATITSVIFGPMPAIKGRGLGMLVLNDVKKGAGWRVEHNGGVYAGTQMRVEKGEIVLVDAGVGEVRVPFGDLIEIRKVE